MCVCMIGKQTWEVPNKTGIQGGGGGQRGKLEERKHFKEETAELNPEEGAGCFFG